MNYFKIYNPIHNLWFGGMNSDGRGGHSWNNEGKHFPTKKGAMTSFRTALWLIPSDFELVEFNFQNIEISRKKMKQISKTRLIEPSDKDYHFRVKEHIEIMAFNKPTLMGNTLILTDKSK